jgi:hypothetical protein
MRLISKTIVCVLALLIALTPALIPTPRVYAQQLPATNYGNFIAGFAAPALSGVGTGTLTYTAGSLYQGGNKISITAGTLTSLSASQGNCASPAYSACVIVYWTSGTALSQTTTYATAAASGNIIVAFVTTDGSSNVLVITPASVGIMGPVPATYTDGGIYLSPANCWMTATTTAFTAGPALVRVATGNQVLSATTNTSAGTVTVNCDISFEGRTTANLGFIATDVSLLYGVQTTALSSIAAAGFNTVAFPAAGGAASGTVATVGGSLTVLPASLQLTTTSSGQCYNENIAFGTPFSFNDNKKVTIDQVFTTAGTTATTLQICGLIMHGKWVQ